MWSACLCECICDLCICTFPKTWFGTSVHHLSAVTYLHRFNCCVNFNKRLEMPSLNLPHICKKHNVCRSSCANLFTVCPLGVSKISQHSADSLIWDLSNSVASQQKTHIVVLNISLCIWMVKLQHTVDLTCKQSYCKVIRELMKIVVVLKRMLDMNYNFVLLH